MQRRSRVDRAPEHTAQRTLRMRDTAPDLNAPTQHVKRTSITEPNRNGNKIISSVSMDVTLSVRPNASTATAATRSIHERCTYAAHTISAPAATPSASSAAYPASSARPRPASSSLASALRRHAFVRH
jgi:hypothetical protein